MTRRSQDISQLQCSDVPRAGPDGRHMSAHHVQQGREQGRAHGAKYLNPVGATFFNATHRFCFFFVFFHVSMATISDTEGRKYVSDSVSGSLITPE